MISELLDDYGWSETDESRRKALIAWMIEATTRIQELQVSISDLTEKLRELEQKTGIPK